MDGGRVGEIVGRHIDGLDRGDGTGVGVGDALFQPGQFGPHRRLVSQSGWHLAHQSRHLHTCLDEAEDVVDEEQDIAVLVVAKILGHRQCGMANSESAARRFIHLCEHHHHVREDAGRLHLSVEFLALSTPFADATEDADAVMMTDHVVNDLGQQHGLTDAGSAKEPSLATAFQGHEHIDDLDAGLEDLGRGRPLCQWWRSAMDRAPLHLGERRSVVDSLTEHVQHAAQDAFPDRRL